MRKLLKEKLTKLQYDVTQNCSTEPPFDNEFWNHNKVGLYVDVISGEALFCSKHKKDDMIDVINKTCINLITILTNIHIFLIFV